MKRLFLFKKRFVPSTLFTHCYTIAPLVFRNIHGLIGTRDQGLQIVGLSMDAGGARDVRPFVAEHDINYTMLIATDKTAQDFGGILGIPTTFVLDRKGTIVKKFIGYTDPAVFEQTIQSLLAQSS